MSNALRAVLDLEPTTEDFRDSVLEGLSQPQKTLSPKFFYDQEGSRLFDRICETAEYYPTRTELGILTERADAIAGKVGPGVRLVEFGSGAGVKVRLLLSALVWPLGYMPVDISRRHLQMAAMSLARDFPKLPIAPVCADYTKPFELPNGLRGAPQTMVGFFPGSTIGNFEPDEARTFLDGARRLLGQSSAMIVGVDLVKDERTLHAAYNDAAGVTAAFNLNLLRRINRELGGAFAIDQFEHQARWNTGLNRIEMHLVSRRDQAVSIGGVHFRFRSGETIHTENSYKYTLDGFATLAASAGYDTVTAWTDTDRLFSVHMLRARREG